MTKQDFVLPKLGQKMIGFREEVRTGRGFQLIRSVTPEHATLPHKTLQLTIATFTAMFLMLFHAEKNCLTLFLVVALSPVLMLLGNPS